MNVDELPWGVTEKIRQDERDAISLKLASLLVQQEIVEAEAKGETEYIGRLLAAKCAVERAIMEKQGDRYGRAKKLQERAEE